MSEYDFLMITAEFVKLDIENNPRYSVWEKWCREAGVEAIKELAREYYFWNA